ncbi:MAG: hypothetical protein JNG88_01215 [Phycisphaerales bacterium]|nr:hypothetical protein [Phycisphaerales bacterium]
MKPFNLKSRTPYGLALIAMQLSTAASGDVYHYAVAKSVGYTQISNDAPVAPDSWLLTAAIYYDIPNEVLSATLSWDAPPPVTDDMYQALDLAHQYYSPLFATEEELDRAYPATTYTLTIDRGAGPEAGDVFLTAGLYPPEIPAFTGDTYDRLQVIDPSQPFHGSLNTFDFTPGMTYGATYLSLVEEGVGGVMTITMANTDVDFEIPAGLLQAEKAYSIGVMHLNGLEYPNAGFGGSSAFVEYSRGTILYFNTPPAPHAVGDMNCDGLVNNFDINPFVLALTDADTYAAQFPDCNVNHADANGDGLVNNFDIDPFVMLLAGG